MINVILMTALVPTTGHLDLIAFSRHLAPTTVIVSGRSFEPVPLELRIAALQESSDSVVAPHPVTFVAHEDDRAPQNPEDHHDFWNWWGERIKTVVPGSFRLVASEAYVKPLAEVLEVPFMTHDIARVMNPSRGRTVRENPFREWSNILPAIRRHYVQRITFFGQESVGKTTQAKLFASRGGSSIAEHATFIPEYAREYLETVGHEVTEERMQVVSDGQWALQSLASRADRPFIAQDTDLYSTIGYYDLVGMPYSEGIERRAAALASDVYFIMPDDIPFEKDILRYGGDKRETTTEYWVNVLERYQQPYVLVPSGTLEEKRDMVWKHAYNMFHTKWDKVSDFERE